METKGTQIRYIWHLKEGDWNLESFTLSPWQPLMLEMWVQLCNELKPTRVSIGRYTIYDLVEDRRINDVTVNFFTSLLGNLRSYDGNCNEIVTLKLNFALS